MPQLIAMIFLVISALVIFSNSFKTDTLSYTDELLRVKKMMLIIDDAIDNTKEKLDKINFESLHDDGLISANYTIVGTANEATIEFPNTNITWQMVPNTKKSYKILVDFRDNIALMERKKLSESYIGQELCVNYFFSDFIFDSTTYDPINEVFLGGGTSSDGIFSCTMYKIK